MESIDLVGIVEAYHESICLLRGLRGLGLGAYGKMAFAGGNPMSLGVT